MREVLVIPKPGLGMLALFLGGLLLGVLVFVLGAVMESILLITVASWGRLSVCSAWSASSR